MAAVAHDDVDLAVVRTASNSIISSGAAPACSIAFVQASLQANTIAWTSASEASACASQRRRSDRSDPSALGSLGSSSASRDPSGTWQSASSATSSLVAPLGSAAVEQAVAQRMGLQRAVARRHREQPIEPEVDVLGAPLDEPVGVEHDRAAGLERHRLLLVARERQHAQRHRPRAGQEVRRAVGAERERRRVPRVDVGQLGVDGVEDGEHERRHVLAGGLGEHECVQPLGDLRGAWPSSA